MSTLSVVTDVFLSKREALAQLEVVLNVRADRRDPTNPYLFMPTGTVLTIEVPKFGEDLPLTLDLRADIPHAVLVEQAESLAKQLGDDLGWSCIILEGQPE
ncbi:hypothetical protein C3B54_111582 [Pontimonas salivibrio]|uniref:Uncharacterized protein n=1 Tax=Pontimonas salivibrio TaxID=1159327 RepID=A0A2L2BS90_9MICO|nr:hypothetical protein [Pontimonas salivibrio]AVG24519.1 hypothetical protein C3B54_111582 [Pontimonas salivibrio]